jgi:hypothetical protein
MLPVLLFAIHTATAFQVISGSAQKFAHLANLLSDTVILPDNRLPNRPLYECQATLADQEEAVGNIGYKRPVMTYH